MPAHDIGAGDQKPARCNVLLRCLKKPAIHPQRLARSFGYLYFGLGINLLWLIIYRVVSRLAH